MSLSWKSVTSHQRLLSTVKSVLVNLVRQSGVKLSTTPKILASTVERSATTPKKSMTTNVESTPISTRAIVPPISFNFKKRLAEKFVTTEVAECAY